MQLTFSKTIDKHLLQFNKLMYPVRYTVKSDDIGSDGAQIEFKQNESGVWVRTQHEGLPEWLDSIAEEINDAITENEKDLVD